MKNEEILEKLQEILEKIKQRNILIIVEGKKDEAALRSFGVSNIVQLSKKPIYEIIENISNLEKECIILTDLDKKGKELYGKLNSGLQKHGVKVNNELREFLFKTKIRQIEGLENLRGLCPESHYFSKK